MKASVKQLKRKWCSLKYEKKLLEKTTEKLARKYSEQITMVRRSLGTLVRRVATHLLGKGR